QQKTNDILEVRVQERTLALAQLNNEYTQSVTYASYIQASLLPSISLIKERLNDSFILYNPRDIVSGDFYWYADVQTSTTPHVGLQVLCAVDCTGHGVPGAFMSLVANNLLDLTVKQESVNTPSDVIAFLNKNLAKAMNKEHSEQVINDGMDIIVCSYQPTTKTLYYAGANRPLYLVKHSTLELIEIKAVKMSIGGYTPLTQEWETTTLQLESGDCYYLSSDGYADQFGGEKDKKITTKRLKQLLVQIHPLTMQEQQQALQNYFTTWQGDQKQIDDVMLIGVRV
ncbi:MAG: SpoIIE family protein phosphatase, partial [Bacteroidia bacterium]|nr:SpoIIE family protein phosphatase [Bacteroidia bacterium]